MNTQARLRAVAAAFIAVLLVSVFAIAPGASAEAPPAPTCPDGLTLVNSTTCEAPATVTTVQANVECAAGYTYSAAIARCEGPGMYVPAVPQVGPRCSGFAAMAAADLVAAYGGTASAAYDSTSGLCRITLQGAQTNTCPKQAPLVAGFITNGTGYCDYAPEIVPAVPAMCNGAATTGTAAECIDTEPIISITCKGATDVLNNDQCTTTACPVGMLVGTVCTMPATIGLKPAVVAPVSAPVVTVPAAGIVGPLVTTTTPAIAIPVQPSAAPAGPAALAMTGPSSAQTTAVNAGIVLVGFGLISLVWAAYFRERQAV